MSGRTTILGPMKPIFFVLCAALAGVLPAAAGAQAGPDAAAAPATFDDGPYLRYAPGEVQARWVCAGRVVERSYAAPAWPVTVPAQCGYARPVHVQAPAEPAPDAVPGRVARIAALSDVHGQYELLRKLLHSNGIVDGRLDWSYGRGHLVIAGDVFDRGPQVNQVLWLLYGLEQQARAAGGAVHLLIGNHEAMVLGNDLRYVNDSYRRAAAELGTPYAELYGPDSVLGRWLRSRPAILRIGDLLFVHGGISAAYLDLGLSRADTNARYRASLGTPKAVWQQDPALAPLYNGKTSPIWYRGYFNDPALGQAEVEALLARLGVRRVVVGHTSHKQIGSYLDGRVIGIDSSIKNGEYGELLLIERGRMQRATPEGERLPLPAMARDAASD